MKLNGDCFEQAAKMLQQLEGSGSVGRDNEFIDNLFLVHGLVTHPEIGFRHVHAWLELPGGVVADFSNGNSAVVDRDIYYEAGEIKEEELRRYTASQARNRLLVHQTYGPWEDELLALETHGLHRG